MCRIFLVASLATAVAGCRVSLSPLQNRIDVGRESFVVFVGDGEGGQGDLYAVKADGGAVYPVSYTRLDETMPALSPNGIMLAFLRGRQADDSTDRRVVVMNLLNGAERVLFTASRDSVPLELAWNPAGSLLYIASTGGVLQATAPPGPAALTAPADSAAADSSLATLLGSPPFASVERCRDGPGVCSVPRQGDEQQITEGPAGIIGWGGDSLAVMSPMTLSVRPLAGGRGREVRWVAPPANTRSPTVFLAPGR